MSADKIRLGDIIDDYCPRCRLLLNHAVASVVDEEVRKVTCQTCHDEHAYRHGQEPKRKKKQQATSLFDQVLGNLPSAEPSPPATTSPTPPSPTRTSKKRSGDEPRYIMRHPGRKKR